MNHPFFSIVIPVYKNVDYLKRLLQSVKEQTFTDYEVVITDDSPDDSIGQYLQTTFAALPIVYHRNAVALGTPENWNEGIRRSKGQWIKLMHDDDWFYQPTALQCFHDAALKSKSKFIFSAYANFIFESNSFEEVYRPWLRWQRVNANPEAIYALNIIGPPSVILVHSSVSDLYDKRMKWLVDIDYYIRLMQEHKPIYINQPLIAVGISAQQVTASCHTNPSVEIPEALLLNSKLSGKPWHNILYFDAWWRLVRNLGIRNEKQFEAYAGTQTIPNFVLAIIKMQKGLQVAKLKNGIYSKWHMSICWLKQL